MADIPRAPAVRGKTMRWTWTEGPTKGQVHEHIFHPDGTVEWHEARQAPADRAAPPTTAKPGHERPPYAAFEVTSDVYAVSYLAPSGFTLTVVLNFASRQLVGFASGKDQWHPVRGTFEVVG
jgi:hypothetical protein